MLTPSHQSFSKFYFFYSLQTSDSATAKKSASESIQIDAKVREDTNQQTRQVAVQLNIVEDDENVTSEPCCAPTNQPFCSSEIWVFHDIETTIRARKCRNPLRIFKWIVHLIFWLIVAIGLFSCFLIIVGAIGGALFGIGYLFYLGTIAGYIFGTLGVMFVLFILFEVDTSSKGCGLCEYLTNGKIRSNRY